jgi:serine/threonine protein kinase
MEKQPSYDDESNYDNYLGILNKTYRIIRFLGQGLTSQVFLALRMKDNKQVAIKIFKPSFLNSGSEARKIFLGELTALKLLDHPNIVKMYEYDIDG